MSLHDAHAILDRVRDGVATPEWLITLALKVTGDYDARIL